MSGSSGGQAGSSTSREQQAQEFPVRMLRDRGQRHHIVKFTHSNVDFHDSEKISLQRENNHKAFNFAYNIDQMPKFGAGSEFGRDQKNEARRKKYGIRSRNYNPEDQPWNLKLTSKGTEKKFKGSKDGGISDNASYFVFVRSRDGSFEISPVDTWYSFTPVQTYKHLDAEEAEAEFNRRDKNLNLFNVMVRHRFKPEEAGEEDSKEELRKALKSKGKGFILKEMEDWADMSDEDGHRSSGDDDEDPKPKKGKGKFLKKKIKKEDRDIDEEAMDDSDDGDFEGRGVDYMSDTSVSESSDDERATKEKYEMKGVEDEDGLREIAASDGEEEEPEEDKNQSKVGKKPDKEEQKKDAESDDSSSSDESDDPDQASDKFASVYLMGGKNDKKPSRPSTPRPATPKEEESARKRKLDSTDSPSRAPQGKKARVGSPATAPQGSPHTGLADRPSTPLGRPNTPLNQRPSTPVARSLPFGSAAAKESTLEESVKRYLARKPLSTLDLLAKFKSKKLGMSSNELVGVIGNILRRLQPVLKQVKVNGTVLWTLIKQ